MSIRTAQRLRKLNDRHRLGARLIAYGFTYSEVSRQIGGHQFYWGRLVKHSTVFQEYLYVVRELVHDEYLAATVNGWAEKLRQRWQRQRYRQGRSASLRTPDQKTASPPLRMREPEPAASGPTPQRPGPQKASSEVARREAESARQRERDWSVEAIDAELAAERHRQQPITRPAPPPLGQPRPQGGLYGRRRF